MRWLTVPGYTSSGPEHWQSHLERTYGGFGRVVQDDWESPDRDQWTARLDATVRGIEDDVFLIGHSCGAVTVAQWAASPRWDDRVVGALLVAPADVEADDALPAIKAQAPLPRVRLPMKTHLVISDNDPHLSLERGLALAETWGTSVEIIPGGGHLATADGFGRWDHIASVISRLSGSLMDPHIS
jgi:predicted alpha/beta hydrolase family esterase